MPGINFIQYYRKPETDLVEAFQRATDGVYRLPDDAVTDLLHTPTLAVNWIGYKDYPVSFWEGDDFSVCLEGRIYNILPERIFAEISEVRQRLFAGNYDLPWLSRRLNQMDGDFLIWLHEKTTGRTFLLNDVFGRLPFYYTQDVERVVASRSLRFVHEGLAAPEIDALSLAHFYMLGHALDHRTLWKQISILTPASLMVIDPLARQVSMIRLHQFNFGETDRRRNRTENARLLAERFTAACNARAGLGDHDVVSLSGGMDSRAVAAGLAAAGAPFSSMTFSYKGYTSREEIDIARQVAAVFDSPWEKVALPPLKGRDALVLLNLKAGLSPLYIAFILTFFRTIRETFGGNAVYFTGDGGDQCLPSLRPPLPLNSLSGLAQYIIEDHHFGGRRLGLDLSAALTGVSRTDIVDSLTTHLRTYPEETMEGKWLHYQLYGIITKIYFVAEDRNRSFLWNMSPFYSTLFYPYAFACPQSQKSAFRLYGRFLRNLSPSAVAIPYSGYQGPLGSVKFLFNYFTGRAKYIRPALTLRLKKLFKGVHPLSSEAVVIHVLRQQMASCPQIGKYLYEPAVKEMLTQIHQVESHFWSHLLNVSSTLELSLCGRSTLAAFADEPLFA